jgi:hypothetical protein
MEIKNAPITEHLLFLNKKQIYFAGATGFFSVVAGLAVVVAGFVVLFVDFEVVAGLAVSVFAGSFLVLSSLFAADPANTKPKTQTAINANFFMILIFNC